MAYRHYETEGLILGHRNLGEANRLYQILTPDFGLINVLAQSIRRDRSKLRFHLENLSFAGLGLVRGRESWRLVGATSLFQPERSSKEGRFFLRKISLVLLRLIHGEEPNFLLYWDIKDSFFLITDPSREVNDSLTDLEIFILARILVNLGYLAIEVDLRRVLLAPNFSWAQIRQLARFRALLIKQINQALESTQL